MLKTSPAQVRCRAQAILRSARRDRIDQIADLYEVDRETVSLWLRAWEEDGSSGLGDQPGRGHKPLLNEPEQAAAIKMVARDPRRPKRHWAAMEKKTGKKLSVETRKKLLKKGGKGWKRVRQGLRGNRDEADFRVAQAEVAGFRAQAAAGAITLYYDAATGVSLTPCVPAAWQDKNTPLTLPTSGGGRDKVLGFFDVCAHQLPSVGTTSNVDTELVSACFDHLRQPLLTPTIVILEQAPTHPSAAFRAHLPAWEAHAWYVYPLSAASPELKLSELLWRKIKDEWRPCSADDSGKTLLRELQKVLAAVRSKYQINFA